MAPRQQESIYRFDSPCGQYCYIGKVNTLAGRIGQHGSDTTSAIFRHCRECAQCDRVRQYDVKWKECFTELGSATGKRRVRELETQYINEACEEYIRVQVRPFPLNEKVELGVGTLLVAAKAIQKERTEHSGEKENLKRERDYIRRELDYAWQECDRLRNEIVQLEQRWNRKEYSIWARIRSLFGSGEAPWS